MRLLALFLFAGTLAHGAPEDYQSPLRFGIELQYGSLSYPNYFVNGVGESVAPRQSAGGIWFEWIPITRYGKLAVGLGYQYVFARSVQVSASQISNVQANVGQIGVAYRVDFLRNQYVVPYARFCLAFVVPRGVDSFPGKVPPSENRINYATQRGTEVVFGGQVLLDWIEPRAAANLDRDIGINNVYLFGEFVQFTSPLGAAIDLSYQGWRAGMRFEF